MQNTKSKEKNNRNRNILLLIIAILLLLLIIWLLYNWQTGEKKAGTQWQATGTSTVVKPDTLHDTTSVLPDTIARFDTTDTVSVKKVIKKVTRDSVKVDTAAGKEQADTTAMAQADTGNAPDSSGVPDFCSTDTTAPWVYPDPSGGLHYSAIEVHFVADEPSVINWRIKGGHEWKRYDGTPVKIDVTETIEFTALDSCGNSMAARSEYYEIRKSESKKYCPDGMEYVKVGEQQFCIDRYEWPNKKGVKPEAFVSKYGASDSCYAAGKRLCNADEWMLACMGPYSWKYPYGQQYERYACSTHDTTLRVSGSKPECRSFFGVYDMSGGLAEWTDTRALENRQFYYVKGGFWESGPQGNCFDKRYSYYPQNRHNPVGFRCCADAEVESKP